MADQQSRINLVLAAQNQQFNSQLQASNEQILKTTSDLEALARQSQLTGQEAQKMSTLQFYLWKEMTEFKAELPIRGMATLGKAMEENGGIAEKLGSKVAKLGHTLEESLNFSSYAAEAIEFFYRLGEGGKKLYDTLSEIPDKAKELREEILSYTEALEQDPFLQAAAEGQKFKAQLTGLTGSAKEASHELEYMYSIAGEKSGGFRSDQIVEAGIALKELNQDIETTLPLAVKLAAGTGKDVPQAATALGNAMSGLNGGFSQLQRSFHLTRAELIGLGASLDQNGEIANQTTKQIEHNAEVLEKAINKKYGNVVEQQAKTIEGAFGSMKESMGQFSEAMGEIYSKDVVGFVNGMAGVITKAKELVPVFASINSVITNVMSPISLGAKTMLYFGDSVVTAIVKANKYLNETKFGTMTKDLVTLGKNIPVVGAAFSAMGAMIPVDKLNQGSGMFKTLAGTMAIATTAILGLVSPMIAFSVGSALLTAGIGKMALKFGDLVKEIPAIGGVLNTASKAVGNASMSFASAGANMAKWTVIASLAAAGAVALTAGFIALDNEIKNTASINKAYTDSLQASREAGLEFEKILGMTDEQLKSGSVSVGSMKLALEGLTDAVEEDHRKIADYKKELAGLKNMAPPAPVNLITRMITLGSVNPEEELKKRQESVKNNLDTVQDLLNHDEERLKEHNERLRKIIAERTVIEYEQVSLARR